jgi:transposase-like protein
MSDKQTRRHFTPPEKGAIVKRHLLEGVPVSNLCDEFDINPTLFYQWQRQLFENAHLAIENARKSRAVEDAKDHKIAQLEAKLTRKNEVMAELMEAHTELKKVVGNSDQILGSPRHTRSARRFCPSLAHRRGDRPHLPVRPCPTV